jgi:hypothetical protein
MRFPLAQDLNAEKGPRLLHLPPERKHGEENRGDGRDRDDQIRQVTERHVPHRRNLTDDRHRCYGLYPTYTTPVPLHAVQRTVPLPPQ